jgi:DNA-binding IclR family transcriptional regulator
VPTTGPPRSGAQSVERALAVLRAFVEGDGADLGVTSIAAATGLTVSTTHRLVQALRHEGVLVQDPGSERYRLGPVLVVLGRLAERRLGLAGARPVLERLAEATGESVNLGVRSGAEVLVVLDVASSQPLRFDQAPGTRVPVHTSAMGKCLLAFTDDTAAEVAALPALTGATDRTITDPTSLLADLEQVRDRGWALNDEERNPGVRAVGAPVLVAGRAAAAIAVQGPTVRLGDASLERVATALVAAAAEVAPLLATTG